MNQPRDEPILQGVREEIEKEIIEDAKAHQLKRASNSEGISKTKAARISFNSMKDYRFGAEAFYLRGKADGVCEVFNLLYSVKFSEEFDSSGADIVEFLQEAI